MPGGRSFPRKTPPDAVADPFASSGDASADAGAAVADPFATPSEPVADPFASPTDAVADPFASADAPPADAPAETPSDAPAEASAETPAETPEEESAEKEPSVKEHKQFRILVLADFSGRVNRGVMETGNIASRKVYTVDADNLDRTIARITPEN